MPLRISKGPHESPYLHVDYDSEDQIIRPRKRLLRGTGFLIRVVVHKQNLNWKASWRLSRGFRGDIVGGIPLELSCGLS
ncbi:hypothetical protein AAMO2058_001355600 [Amorphochlora amoebiformis]